MTGPQILALMEAASMLVRLIQESIAKGKERGEWTLQQEADFELRLSELQKSADWQVRD